MSTLIDPFQELIGFPRDVKHAIEMRLRVPYVELRPLTGGTNNRTFVAKHETQAWVVRLEAAGGVQLRRAYAAQMLARRAGVAVPEIVDCHLDTHHGEQYMWMIEELIPGVHFEPMAFDQPERNALAFHLGQQLRMLHSITVDAFGIMPPDPWDMMQPTFAASIEHEMTRIPRALKRAGMDLTVLPYVADVYAMLRDGYSDLPRLCHGDCATSNILVDQGRVTGLIDWEWAKGGDPASNIAYWAFWQDDSIALDALLAGYQPDEPARFRARVLAYRVVTATELILVYMEHGGPEDIRFCQTKLEDALRTRPWLD